MKWYLLIVCIFFLAACADTVTAPATVSDTASNAVVTPTWNPASGTPHPYEGDSATSLTVQQGDWIIIHSLRNHRDYKIHIDAVNGDTITVSGYDVAFAFNGTKVIYVSDPNDPPECANPSANECRGYLPHPLAIVRSIVEGNRILVLGMPGDATYELAGDQN